MIIVAQTKIKMTKSTLKVLTLKKLLSKGIGTNRVETFTRREVGTKCKDRIKALRNVMRIKVEDAEREESKIRESFARKYDLTFDGLEIKSNF